MRTEDDALVLVALPHGEHGAIIRFLGEETGLVAGYVAGARGRRKRAAIQPGNKVRLTLSARTEGQLPGASFEMIQSRALIAFAAEPAAALVWVTELTAHILAERDPHPRLYHGLDALLSALDAGLSGTSLAGAIARFELLLLAESGLGLDLSACAMGGEANDLAFVSPNSGRAVSASKAQRQPWAHRLLPLPPFLLDGNEPDEEGARAALALTGHFLMRHWLGGQPKLLSVRQRLLHLLLGTSCEQLAGAPPPTRSSP